MFLLPTLQEHGFGLCNKRTTRRYHAPCRAGETRDPELGNSGLHGGEARSSAAGQDGTRTGSSEWELHTSSLPGPSAVPAGPGTGRAEGAARVEHRQGTSGWAQRCTRGRQRQTALELSCTEALEKEASQKNQPCSLLVAAALQQHN